jgi:hypothetical protein
MVPHIGREKIPDKSGLISIESSERLVTTKGRKPNKSMPVTGPTWMFPPALLRIVADFTESIFGPASSFKFKDCFGRKGRVMDLMDSVPLIDSFLSDE